MFKLLLTISLIVFTTVWAQVTDSGGRPVVETKNGKLRGVINENANRKFFYAFRGIPYAKPPLGKLRFKQPEPAEPWEGVRNAGRESQWCMQFDVLSRKKVGAEDCLYLNVYKPASVKIEATNGSSSALPVLVYIHGGAFSSGSGSAKVVGAEKMMDEDIVLVTMNYRLHILGFLSTEDDAAYGNYGLWDQHLALKWVKENIDAFGGDPDKIVISGNSAGAMSVGLHLISKHNTGLFSGAIVQSGAPTQPGVIQRNPLQNAKIFAECLNCTKDCNFAMVDCLRTKTADQIYGCYYNTFVEQNPLPTIPILKPNVETGNTNGFITEHPTKLFLDGEFIKVPVITGVNENEGGFFYLAMKHYTNFDHKYMENGLKPFLGAMTHLSDTLLDQFTDAIKELYFKGYEEDETKVAKGFQDFWTDCFLSSTDLFAKLLSKHGVRTYVYLLTHKGKNSLASVLDPDKGNYGVIHADELCYLYDGFLCSPISDGDKLISRRLITMWTNFAEYGDPTHDANEAFLPLKWPDNTENAEDTLYYVIQRNIKIETNYREQYCDFFNNKFPKVIEQYYANKDEL